MSPQKVLLSCILYITVTYQWLIYCTQGYDFAPVRNMEEVITWLCGPLTLSPKLMTTWMTWHFWSTFKLFEYALLIHIWRKTGPKIRNRTNPRVSRLAKTATACSHYNPNIVDISGAFFALSLSRFLLSSQFKRALEMSTIFEWQCLYHNIYAVRPEYVKILVWKYPWFKIYYIWILTPGTWLNLFEKIIQEHLELNLLWFDFCHVTLNLTKSCHFWSLLIWRYNLTNRLVRIFYWQQKQTLKTIKLHFYMSSKRNTLWK